ncbi:DUF871 family protein [Bacillus sp. IITD106]|nr:DUF871 family protein [Bacillus sp. IITD106]
MLGVSVYLGYEKISKQGLYLRKMKEHGFKSIFTSLHIPEDNPSEYKEQLSMLGSIAKELDMELMADISPLSIKMLGLDWNNEKELLNWGLSGLRTDYGIDENTIVALSHQMKIALNASTITNESLNRMKNKGLNINQVEAWHNFYPRPETGLGWEDFIERNKWLKEKGLIVMAFIPGDETLRGPLFAKLPTLESHREYSPFAAYLELKNKGYVDKILIGDVQISDIALEQFEAYRQGEILLRCKACKETNIKFIKKLPTLHTNRADHARDCIRSVESRQYASIGKCSILPSNCVQRPIGSITIDNEKYRRYQGELQITLNNLRADEKVNVLGRVVSDDRRLLPFIKGNQKFRLKWELS